MPADRQSLSFFLLAAMATRPVFALETFMLKQAMPASQPPEPLLKISGLTVTYPAARGRVMAVDKVSLTICQGETLGLVGESGCGKSTLGRAIARLIEPTAGSIKLNGQELVGLSKGAMRAHRRDVQIIFQDPFASLNPRWRAGDLVAEPLAILGERRRAERRARVLDLLRRVGLPSDAANRYPHEFSGGQRQRIGIARALTLQPKLIICDEPVSALDVSVQAQVLNLLVGLQRETGVSLLFISHDLSVVEYIADRVAVMYLGRIVEEGSREKIWDHAAHPYTQSLLRAIPGGPFSHRARSKVDTAAEPPSLYSPPLGCHFHPRCPIAIDRCRVEAPPFRVITQAHSVACHLA
jgi:peptide/nickel transport system ATP-binding protein